MHCDSPSSLYYPILQGSQKTYFVLLLTALWNHFLILKSSWSNAYRAELFWNDDSNGVIWDIVNNETSVSSTSSARKNAKESPSMVVVGAFDTIAKTSQLQFCSVSKFDGFSFDKVGEGLCPRGGDSSSAIQILSTVIGNGGDIYVGGSFESRVWDGHSYVTLYHVAHFDANSSSWLQLKGGHLHCDLNDYPRVTTLAFVPEESTLFLGGYFHTIQDKDNDAANSKTARGLAMWSPETGLIPFEGGGVSNTPTDVVGCIVQCISYEHKSKSLFVAGTFQRVGEMKCLGVAVWHRPSATWHCL